MTESGITGYTSRAAESSPQISPDDRKGEKMLEFEKKLMLTVPEYRSLMKLRDNDAEIICQTNYYYDSDGHLTSAELSTKLFTKW